MKLGPLSWAVEDYCTHVLYICDQNISEAARILKIQRITLRKHVAKYKARRRPRRKAQP